jgi:hypothetical protein
MSSVGFIQGLASVAYLLSGGVFRLKTSRIGILILWKVHTAAWLHMDVEVVRRREIIRKIYGLLCQN